MLEKIHSLAVIRVAALRSTRQLYLVRRRLYVILAAILFLAAVLYPSVAARGSTPTGFLQYFIPGDEEQLYSIFRNLTSDPGSPADLRRMHAVIAVTASTDGTLVYYDHWEDGYDFDINNPATADETVSLDRGQVRVFESPSIPVFPRGSGVFYDGRDRLFIVGGATTVTRASWLEGTGTVLALAWELYPVKPLLTHYTIPAGENLADPPFNYADFDQVYLIVQSTADNNNVQIDDPQTPGVEVNVTLQRGQVTELRHINAGTRVSADEPVQVQFIVGRRAARYEIRGYSAVPDSLWDTEYYNPVGSFSENITELYLYNPNSSAISIGYQDLDGSGSFSIPAGGTLSYSDGRGDAVPQDSGVYLFSDSVFWGIGSADSGSPDYDWGYSLVPVWALADEYYLGWAPGTSEATPTANGSPVFVTPLKDGTTIFIDFSPTDGVPDTSFLLNRLETRKIADPDNNNTAMHIWATDPIAVVWGEDPDLAGPGNPYLDLGYSSLPLRADWIDAVLTIEKNADPNLIPARAGEVVTFSLEVSTYAFPVDDVVVADDLPPGWEVLPGETIITLPDSSTVSGAAADPEVSGQTLTWDLRTDMGLNQTLSIVFQARTTEETLAGVQRNDAQARGIRLGGAQVFAPLDSDYVYLFRLTIDKDTSTPLIDPGGTARYTIEVVNEDQLPISGVEIADQLPDGFSFLSAAIVEVDATRSGALAPSPGDDDLVWGTWTIEPGGSVLITLDVLVDPEVPPGTYDNSASVTSSVFGQFVDVGDTGDDPDAPPGADPETDEDVTVNDLLPSIAVVKTVTPTTLDEPGGPASFTISVENTSVEKLNLTALTDDRFGDLNGQGSCSLPQEILAGESYECSFSATVTGNAGDVHRNQVTAEANDGDGNTVSASDDATLTLVDILPTIAVEKSGDPTSLPEPGGSVVFSVRVENSGSEAVTLFELVDDIHGNLDGQGSCVLPQVLAVGAEYSCAFSALVSGNAGDSEVNTVSAVARDDEGNLAQAADDALVDLTDALPTIEVEKNASPPAVAEPGGVVEFAVAVRNTSAEGLVLTSLGDDVYGDLDGQGSCLLPQTLLPGQTYNCAFSALVSGNAGEIFTNTVTASARDDEGNPASASDDALVTINDVLPTLLISKQALPELISEPGGEVSFNLRLENPGVEPLTLFSLQDDVFGDLNGRGSCLLPQTLLPEGVYECAFSAVVAGNAGTTHVNTVTALAQDDEGNLASAEDRAVVSFVDALPSFIITKTAEPQSVTEPGGLVVFNILVDNNSAEAITLFELVDDIHGDLDGQGSCVLPQTLVAGGDYLCSFSATVAGSAGDTEVNTVTAQARDDEGNTVSASDDALVTVLDVLPEIELEKTATPPTIDEPGGLVVFEVAVLNNSPEAVTLSSLLDDVYGDLNGQGSCSLPQVLLAGERYECAFSALVSGNAGEVLVDTITASASDNEGNQVRAADDAAVTILDVLPSLTLTKAALTPTLAEPGGTASFSVLVENTGVEPLTLLTLIDDQFGSLDGQGSCSLPQTIAVGGSYFCIFQGAVAGNAGETHTNTLSASGEDDEGNPVTAIDDAEVFFTDLLPSIAVEKTAASQTVLEPGALVTFSVSVENTSQEGVELIGLSDDRYGDLNGQGSCALRQTLGIGETYQCAFSALVSGDAGETHTNLVTALAEDDEGNQATAQDDAVVAVLDVLPEIRVTKSADPTTLNEPGGLVTFAVEVENLSGETLTLTGLEDDIYGSLDGQGSCALPQVISAGGSYRCEFSQLLSGNAAEVLVDVVTATAVDNENNTARDSDEAMVTILDLPAAITISKTPDPVLLVEPGGAVTFSVRVENTSIADQVTLNSMIDSIYGDLDGRGTCVLPQVLVPGASYTCAFSAAFFGAAGDEETNLVTVLGTDDDGNSLSASAEATVTIVGAAKVLSGTSLPSTSDPQVAIGEIAYYETTLTVPSGALNAVRLVDLLESGLAFVACESITPSSPLVTSDSGSFADLCAAPTVSAEPPGSLAPQDQGRRATFDLGNLINASDSPQTLTVRYWAVVLNTLLNQEGVSLGNAAAWSWQGGEKAASAVDLIVAEPEMTISKSASPTTTVPGATITIDLVIRHSGGAPGFDVLVTDQLPSRLTYISGSLQSVAGPAPDLLEVVGGTLRAGWEQFPIAGQARLRFRARLGVVFPGSTITNTARLQWSSLPDEVRDPLSPHNAQSIERGFLQGSDLDNYADQDSASIGVPGIPVTGFAPGVVSELPDRAAVAPLRQMGGLRLEIPSLGLNQAITGVPLGEGGWDVSWLWNQVGYLEGTAYPTWNGNTVLTGHIYLSNGLPGPFIKLGQLGWGDQVVIQSNGLKYTYEVRERSYVRPNDKDLLKHEAYDWLTLLTCADYSERLNTYRLRLAVRAVLIAVE